MVRKFIIKLFLFSIASFVLLFFIDRFAFGATYTEREADVILQRHQSTPPSTPPSGKVRVYSKSDNKLYILDSTATSTEVGSAAGTANNTANTIMRRNGSSLTALSGVDFQKYGSTPSSPASGYMRVYCKSNSTCYAQDENGTETSLFGAASAITALTGDVTATGPGSVAATIANDAVTDAKLRNSSALSVIGRSANSSGDPADISAGTDFNILRRSGTTLGFGSIDLSQSGAVGSSILGVTNGGLGSSSAPSSGQIPVGNAGGTAYAPQSVSGDATLSSAGALTIANDAVTNAKLANMAQSTIKGRAVSAGTGDPTDLTTAQATAILDNFVGDSGSGGTKGLVPAPAAGDAAAGKFLKANGTWATTSGGGSTITAWTSYTPTINGFGTTSSVAFYYHCLGTDTVEVHGTFTAGTLSGTSTFDIPGGGSIDSAKISANTTSNGGQIIGEIATGVANQNAWIVTATTTSTTVVYPTNTFNANSHLTPTAASAVFSNSQFFSVRFSVPVTSCN